QTRRSVRKYSDRPVTDDLVDKILEAGRWAPSGMNNQPWRFVVVRDPQVKSKIGALTKYTRVLESAPVIIPVFIHKPAMYQPVKDYQSMGACLQNMLLMAHGLGLGAVWLGEILKNGDEVRRVLELDDSLELMAVIAMGWPGEGKPKSSRAPLGELLLARHEG
ncbi:MAG: nitroreductase, partial [Desulfarculaceae bacterium]